MTNQDVNKAKSNGQYRLAGQLDRLLGNQSSYGCHFGMRSELEQARSEYTEGYTEIDIALNQTK